MERHRRFLSLEDACEFIFMDSDPESEPLGDLQDFDEDVLVGGDVSDILMCVLKLKTFPALPLERKI